MMELAVVIKTEQLGTVTHNFTQEDLDKAEQSFQRNKCIPVEDLITVLMKNWRKENSITL